eukprot:6567-Heterococcus_DN1.PRE.13
MQAHKQRALLYWRAMLKGCVGSNAVPTTQRALFGCVYAIQYTAAAKRACTQQPTKAKMTRHMLSAHVCSVQYSTAPSTALSVKTLLITANCMHTHSRCTRYSTRCTAARACAARAATAASTTAQVSSKSDLFTTS